MTTQQIGLSRKPRQLLTIACLISFHLIFSFIAMFWLAREFNFGKRVVLLHVSVVAGLVAVITLILGLSLLLKPVREQRLPKLLLSFLPALSFMALLVLYIANYVSNSKWGNNFNHQVFAQWQLTAELGDQSQRLLAPEVYLSLLVMFLVICGVYLALSRPTFRALEELFLPGRPLSWLRDPKRAKKFVAAAGLAGLIFGLYLFVLARAVKDVGHLSNEPIIGFFRNDTESAEDLSRLKVLPVIREREKQRRGEYPRNQKFSRRNVIVIMVDSLRPDHMQVYGYQRPTTPFLSSLAASGQLTKVDFALATCPFTSCGVLSTLASRTFKSLIPETFKLHELLFDQGYQVNFVLAGNHDWYSLKNAYGTSINYYFDGNNSDRYTSNDDRVVLEGLEQVPAYSGTPIFFYFHLMSTHYIGVKQDRYRVYNPSVVEGTWEALVGGKYDVATKTNNYDNGVVQADATIEQIFQVLQQKGYLDNSLAVILSDHGEGLGERGPDYYSHTLSLYQEFIRIPILIYDASVQEQGDVKFGRQIDVAPTVLERLGLSVPPSWQGRSLSQPASPTYSFHETRRFQTPIYAVIEWSESTIYKYVHSGAGDDELYELAGDPREQQNLIAAASPELIGRMKAKLAEYRTQY